MRPFVRRRLSAKLAIRDRTCRRPADSPGGRHRLHTSHAPTRRRCSASPRSSAVTRAYLEAAQAPSTRRAYHGDWRHFLAWCADRAVDALPAAPETVADYVADVTAGVSSASTIGRHLTAVRSAHLA
jgi:hypothetical protein